MLLKGKVMDYELRVEELIKELKLIRRLELQDVIYLEVTEDLTELIWSNECFVFQVFKRDASYKKLTYIEFIEGHLTKENFPELFIEKEVVIDDVIKRIKNNKIIEACDVFDLKKIKLPNESVHISYFNYTYSSFVVVTESAKVVDVFIKILETIGLSNKRLLNNKLLEVVIDLNFSRKKNDSREFIN
ncbi:hypothetical protein CXF68_16755 [Tenacibaculum sp. Bg11-29]|uniref:hypothetical protein n=1 Tax=Tenacibaculum sp. Bg11-29 TaxID=2058306 RepID=UPI000C348209|nr:hypothetical protein [Tenacibaculum sp. Bg11-29]PKH52240.1 hypothetical protein CXF68_16755 [Tenacibaculum sp. Bg11-29]